MKRELFFWSIAIILSVVAIWATFPEGLPLTGYSAFAVAFGKAVLGGLAFYLFDKVMLKEVDTIKQIKRGNTAYAIFILSYALIVAACIATG